MRIKTNRQVLFDEQGASKRQIHIQHELLIKILQSMFKKAVATPWQWRGV